MTLHENWSNIVSNWLLYCIKGLNDESVLMGGYCTPPRGTMEIMPPQRTHHAPKGCIMPPEGCRRPLDNACPLILLLVIWLFLNCPLFFNPMFSCNYDYRDRKWDAVIRKPSSMSLSRDRVDYQYLVIWLLQSHHSVTVSRPNHASHISQISLYPASFPPS